MDRAGEGSSSNQVIAVVGAGLTGLAAAHSLARAAARPASRPPALVVLEARDRVGGTIQTESRDGFLLEHGPEAFHIGRTQALDLVRELGLDALLQEPCAGRRRSFVVRRGQPVAVPDGLAYAVAPTRLGPLLATPLLSWRGKLRLLLDLALPRRGHEGPADQDETLASFVRRRLGREMLDHLVQPLIGEHDAADPADLSLQARCPDSLRLEDRHRSLIRAGRALACGPRSAGAFQTGFGRGPLVTLADGMATLPRALADRLPERSLRTGTPVRRLSRIEGPRPRWHIERLDAPPIDADAVILATEAHAAARLVDTLDPEFALTLRSIPYASTAIVQVAYQRDQIRHPLDGSGLVVPALERRHVFAASFSSVKFPSRAPNGTVLLRATLGGALHLDHLDQPDETLVQHTLADLSDFLRIRGEPIFTHLVRHARALPQYTLGHLDRVARLHTHLTRHPGLFLAGNYLTGTSLADGIASGYAAAQAILSRLGYTSRIAAA